MNVKTDNIKIEDFVILFDDNVKINSKEVLEEIIVISNHVTNYTKSLNTPMMDMNAISNFTIGKISECISKIQKVVGMLDYVQDLVQNKNDSKNTPNINYN